MDKNLLNKSLVITAAFNPPIFKELVAEGFMDSPEFLIMEYLKTKGFAKTGATKCAEVFVKNIQFIKTLG